MDGVFGIRTLRWEIKVNPLSYVGNELLVVESSVTYWMSENIIIDQGISSTEPLLNDTKSDLIIFDVNKRWPRVVRLVFVVVVDEPRRRSLFVRTFRRLHM